MAHHIDSVGTQSRKLAGPSDWPHRGLPLSPLWRGTACSQQPVMMSSVFPQFPEIFMCPVLWTLPNAGVRITPQSVAAPCLDYTLQRLIRLPWDNNDVEFSPAVTNGAKFDVWRKHRPDPSAIRLLCPENFCCLWTETEGQSSVWTNMTHGLALAPQRSHQQVRVGGRDLVNIINCDRIFLEFKTEFLFWLQRRSETFSHGQRSVRVL